MSRHSVIVQYQGLARAVRYSLKRRSPSPFLFLCFVGPDGRRLEKTSKVCTEKRAHEVAPGLIQDEYTEAAGPPAVTWDEAWAHVERAARGDNVRPGTLDVYKRALATVREAFPGLKGPAELTDGLARQWKASRAAQVGPRTLVNNLQALHSLWGKWWGKAGIVSDNPWEGIEAPTVEKKEPRRVEPAEEQRFLDWLLARYDGWRLPYLFVLTKAAIGCRNFDLAQAETAWLRDGRICFPAWAVKDRRYRECLLPPALYAELRALAGPRFVWETFRLRPKCASAQFKPRQLVRFVQNALRRYFRKTGARRFVLHSFRGTAMSRYLEASRGDYQGAAIAFGCSVNTMRKHYASFQATPIADEVFRTIQGRYA
jgi:integrase